MMNIDATIEIDQMTADEKVRLMELLWRDLAKDPEDVRVPDWHGQTLDERDKAIANGETAFVEFDEVVSYIRDRANAIRGGR